MIQVPEAYRTRRGIMYQAAVEDFIKSSQYRRYRGKVQLIFTSPPFALTRKKKYGNRQGDAYIEWLAGLAQKLRELVRSDGSIVVELGNSWEPGRPVMSTLALRSLLEFQERAGLVLCQEFICHNPARLPTPAQWVTVERIRVKDSFTHVWWMAPSDRPYADNSQILQEYSASMLRLLKRGAYNSGSRPSEHGIGTQSFLKDNDGAIPPSVLFLPQNVLAFSNTRSRDAYLSYCRDRELPPHPARMQAHLAEFFIKFLSRPRQLVLDPFAGSNTTGSIAENLKRRWASIEPNPDYVEGSRGRFPELSGSLNVQKDR